MPTIAASTTFFATSKDDSWRKVVVTVFVPEPLEGNYGCVVSWDRVLRSKRFVGVDMVQALVYALSSIRLDLERLGVQGWRFSRRQGGEPLDLDAIYPRLWSGSFKPSTAPTPQDQPGIDAEAECIPARSRDRIDGSCQRARGGAGPDGVEPGRDGCTPKVSRGTLGRDEALTDSSRDIVPVPIPRCERTS